MSAYTHHSSPFSFPKDEKDTFYFMHPASHIGTLALILCLYYRDNSAELTEPPFSLDRNVQSAGGSLAIDI